MSSTADSERPPAASEKPLLDHITTDSPEDSYPDSENPAKLKNAKNIGTTTPEVEGEDNEPVTAIEDYPSTPISTMDSSFQALPLTGESREDSTPLPPTPEDPEFGVSKEAETTNLPPPTEVREGQLDGAEEPKTVNLETLAEKVEEGLAPEAANLKILEQEALNEEPSEDAPGASGEEPATLDGTPTVLDASDLNAEVLKTAEPIEGHGGKSGDTPGAEVVEGVAEKLSSEIIDTRYQDNTEAQTIQDFEPAIDESKAGEAAHGSEKDEVQQEHEAKEVEHPEVTEPAMGNTDPNTITAEHTPDALVEAVVEEREDREVKPKAEEADAAIGDHESNPESEAVPVREADSVPSPEKDSFVAEVSEMTQSEAKYSEARDAPELVASPEAEEDRLEATETAGVEPEKENLLLEKGAEVAEEPKDKVGDEPGEDLEALKEGSEEEPKEEVETTLPTEAEPPTIDFLPLTEPSREEVSIPSTVGEDTPDSGPAEESTEESKEESKPETNRLVEAETQAVEVLAGTELSEEGDDSPSVETNTGVEPKPAEESKEDMKVETGYEVKEEPEPEPAGISVPVEADPAVPDALPLTEAPIEEEVPSVDVNADPQSELAEESKEDEKQVLEAEPPVEGLAETPEETVDSILEEPEAGEGAGAPVFTGASRDEDPSQELKEAVAAEPEVPALPEQSTEPEQSKESLNVPEFTEQSVEKGKKTDPEPDIPGDGEQEAQEAVQATSILDKESEHKLAEAANPPPAGVKAVVPVEIRGGNDAGLETSIGESEETTKPEPVTGPEPETISTETLVEDDKLSEPVEVPTVIVEKTVGDPPSHGEDPGLDAIEGQKEAFEKRKADAGPDEIIVAEKSPAPPVVPVEENTFEPTPDDSGEASSKPMDGIKAESAANPATDLVADEKKGEGLAQDEPVVVSHDDAPPDEVEKAEAAVEYPRPDPQGEAAEAQKEAEAEKDGKPPISPEQVYDGELGEESSTVEELVAVAAVVAGEAAVAETDGGKDIPQETSPFDEPESFESPGDIATEDVLTPGVGEPGVVTLAETSDKVKEPTSSKEIEETPVAREIAHVVLPVASDVKPTVQTRAPAESQSEEQIFSINPLPDSKTFGNPINLRPGEPIPVCLTEASVADNVKLDEEIFKQPEDKATVAEEAKAEGSDGGTGEKTLAAGAGASLVGLGAYAAAGHFDDETEASKHSSEKASPVSASPADPKVGGVGSPAVDVLAKAIPSTAQDQVLPAEFSLATPAIPEELSESPVVSKTGIEPAHPVDKPTEEIVKPVGTEALGKNPSQASAADIPDELAVNQPVGKPGPDEGDEAIAEPAPQNALSPVHGVVVPEEHIPKALEDAEASEIPAIVVSAPPNPATGSSTAEVIQPSPSEVAFNEASANKARESENTPEGVRRRRAPGAGGEVSRPTSSGADTVSTRHHRNIMNGFWHFVLFGWLGGFGRFFGGIFSKSKSRKQRK